MISFGDIERTINIILFGQNQKYLLANADGSPIIGFKTMLKAEYKSDGKTVFEPIEENSFATYNKTTEPRDFYFELALQFPNQDFGVVLGVLENLKKSTDLFIFITPFNSYSDLTLEGYSTVFETTTSMLIVGLQCKEVIQVAQGYTNVTINDATPINGDNAKDPSSTTTSNTGMTGTRAGTKEEKENAERSGMVIIAGEDEENLPNSNTGQNGGGFEDDEGDGDNYGPD